MAGLNESLNQAMGLMQTIISNNMAAKRQAEQFERRQEFWREQQEAREEEWNRKNKAQNEQWLKQFNISQQTKEDWAKQKLGWEMQKQLGKNFLTRIGSAQDRNQLDSTMQQFSDWYENTDKNEIVKGFKTFIENANAKKQQYFKDFAHNQELLEAVDKKLENIYNKNQGVSTKGLEDIMGMFEDEVNTDFVTKSQELGSQYNEAMNRFNLLSRLDNAEKHLEWDGKINKAFQVDDTYSESYALAKNHIAHGNFDKASEILTDLETTLEHKGGYESNVAYMMDNNTREGLNMLANMGYKHFNKFAESDKINYEMLHPELASKIIQMYYDEEKGLGGTLAKEKYKDLDITKEENYAKVIEGIEETLNDDELLDKNVDKITPRQRAVLKNMIKAFEPVNTVIEWRANQPKKGQGVTNVVEEEVLPPEKEKKKPKKAVTVKTKEDIEELPYPEPIKNSLSQQLAQESSNSDFKGIVIPSNFDEMLEKQRAYSARPSTRKVLTDYGKNVVNRKNSDKRKNFSSKNPRDNDLGWSDMLGQKTWGDLLKYMRKTAQKNYK